MISRKEYIRSKGARNTFLMYSLRGISFARNSFLKCHWQLSSVSPIKDFFLSLFACTRLNVCPTRSFQASAGRAKSNVKSTVEIGCSAISTLFSMLPFNFCNDEQYGLDGVNKSARASDADEKSNSLAVVGWCY